jgi:hypothetical protein
MDCLAQSCDCDDFKLRHQASAAVDGSGKQANEHGDELVYVLAALIQADQPLPRKRAHFLEQVRLSVGAADKTEVDATVLLDAWQQREVLRVQAMERMRFPDRLPADTMRSLQTGEVARQQAVGRRTGRCT